MVSHIIQGVGAALVVGGGGVGDAEAQVLVKSHGLGVLLVHGQPRYAVVSTAVRSRRLPRPLPRASGARNSISRLSPAMPRKPTGLSGAAQAASRQGTWARAWGTHIP